MLVPVDLLGLCRALVDGPLRYARRRNHAGTWRDAGAREIIGRFQIVAFVVIVDLVVVRLFVDFLLTEMIGGA